MDLNFIIAREHCEYPANTLQFRHDDIKGSPIWTKYLSEATNYKTLSAAQKTVKKSTMNKKHKILAAEDIEDLLIKREILMQTQTPDFEIKRKSTDAIIYRNKIEFGNN